MDTWSLTPSSGSPVCSRLMKISLALLILLSCIGNFRLQAEESPSQPWDMDKLKEVPEFRWIKEDAPIKEVIYSSGVSLEGKPTEAFAFYADPDTAGVSGFEKPYPGVVLIHGGGGTAFAEWVWLWANRGYAAIAMDLSGRRPPSPDFDEEGKLAKDNGNDKDLRERIENGGPEAGRPEKFTSIGGDITDDWAYHTVANVMRAHSLLRSFDQVDGERTAVTGISWGGYSTCLAASNDDRFKAAVPVYGCGFLFEGDSVQKSAIDELEPERRNEWIERWDPSSHLVRCRVPILFVNGTHDIHYPLDSYQKSYDVVPGEKSMRIQLKMAHGHRPGWLPEEIGIFIDAHCRGGKGLATLSKPVTGSDGQVSVSFETPVPITSATLHYTTDSGLRSKREWQKREAAVGEGVITVEAPPEDANTWFITATDERDAMISTTVQFQ